MIVEAQLNVSPRWKARARYALEFLAQATGVTMRCVDTFSPGDSILLLYAGGDALLDVAIPPRPGGRVARTVLLIPALLDERASNAKASARADASNVQNGDTRAPAETNDPRARSETSGGALLETSDARTLSEASEARALSPDAADAALLMRGGTLRGLPGLPNDPSAPIFGPLLTGETTPELTDLDPHSSMAVMAERDDGVRRRLFAFDFLANIFLHVSRLEELHSIDRDRFGRFTSPSSILSQNGVLHTPVVDRFAAFFLDLLRDEQAAASGVLARVAQWPGGEPCAVSLTHDVDQSVSWPRQLVRDLQAAARAPRATQPLQSVRKALVTTLRHLSRKNRDPLLFPRRVRDYERGQRVRSSWFFLTVTSDSEGRRYNVSSRPFRAFLRELRKQGFEVGLHGSIQAAGNAHEMENERRTIEHVIGERIEGNRQHYLVFSAGGTFWDLHEAGIRHDSSVGYSDAVGFRAGTSLPFHPYDHARDERIEMMEIPLGVMDVARIKPGEERVSLDALWTDLLQRGAAIGGLVTVLWHPRMFDFETHPAGRAPYESLVRMAKDRELPFLRTHDIARWWRAREGVTLLSYGVRGGALSLRYSVSEPVEQLTISVSRVAAAGGAERAEDTAVAHTKQVVALPRAEDAAKPGRILLEDEAMPRRIRLEDETTPARIRLSESDSFDAAPQPAPRTSRAPSRSITVRGANLITTRGDAREDHVTIGPLRAASEFEIVLE